MVFRRLPKPGDTTYRLCVSLEERWLWRYDIITLRHPICSQIDV
jgi:hypothetical protein